MDWTALGHMTIPEPITMAWKWHLRGCPVPHHVFTPGDCCGTSHWGGHDQGVGAMMPRDISVVQTETTEVHSGLLGQCSRWSMGCGGESGLWVLAEGMQGRATQHRLGREEVREVFLKEAVPQSPCKE